MNRKVAIPMRKNDFCAHFGESDQFAIVEVDESDIVSEDYDIPPDHKPGAFPQWLSAKGVTHVIAGGIGRRALEHFRDSGITPITGVEQQSIVELIYSFINDELVPGENSCHHG